MIFADSEVKVDPIRYKSECGRYYRVKVRITHLATGTYVVSSEERCEDRNRERAMMMLANKVSGKNFYDV